MVASDRFLKPGALLASITAGEVRPLRGTYIIELATNGKPILRRQELPDRAFFDEAELMAVLHKLHEKFGQEKGDECFMLLFHALSYRWLTAVARKHSPRQ